MTRLATILTVLLLAAPGDAFGQAANAPPVTARRIRVAVDDAVTFLRALQQPDGSIHANYNPDGETALAALTMLAAGGSPASDDQLRKALDWLAAREPNNTYVRGIRANVWEYALRKVPYDKRIRELLKTDYEWLLAALGDREGWRYNMQSRDWDNSCSQYGVLGIWAAARAGFEPGEKFWQTMSKHFRDCQSADGGWSYTRGGSTPNMATAGLASMFLVFDTYHGRTCYSRQSPRTFTEGEASEVLASIERGMNWLGSAPGNKDDGYYLYGIERTGVARGRQRNSTVRPQFAPARARHTRVFGFDLSLDTALVFDRCPLSCDLSRCNVRGKADFRPGLCDHDGRDKRVVAQVFNSRIPPPV